MEPRLTHDPFRRVGATAPLPPHVLARHAPDAAAGLLGALLVRDVDGTRVVARIVETEAYREDDPASHSYARRTSRVEPMFARPGTAYVYRSYGIHWCLNVSVEAEGVGAAVLLRAAVVLRGDEVVRERRPSARTGRDLLRGPGNLARGLGVDGPSHDRSDLLVGDAGLALSHDAWGPDPAQVRAGPRVGIRHAVEVPWRFHLAGVPEVSRYVRSPRALDGRTSPRSA